MQGIDVTFKYIPSVYGEVFEGYNAMLVGSWTTDGIYSDQWTEVPMARKPHDDGGECFNTVVTLDESQIGQKFHWGVKFKNGGTNDFWGIATEENDSVSKECRRSFTLSKETGDQKYYLTHCRRLGANKFVKSDGTEGVRFAVWAPNAIDVDLVFGKIWNIDDPLKTAVSPNQSLAREKIAGGYIYPFEDDNNDDNELRSVKMYKGADDVWETAVAQNKMEDALSVLNHRAYMFRIKRHDNSIVYRSDLYSRCQMGGGTMDPAKEQWSGLLKDVEGTKSCSATINPEEVTKEFDEPVWPETEYISQNDFWKDEFTGKVVPKKVQDLIIYELHLGALGFGSGEPGNLSNACELLDHLEKAHFNAVELLPLSEFGGGAQNWGYSTTHYCAIEYGGGGRDQFKFFIKECHQRGIAVIMDVVYNHYAVDAERAEWQYDNVSPEKNIYYWYEGEGSNYPNWDGGYVDNMSSGWAPRYWEEMVRKMFISSAVSLVQEFHIDGFRVDQTTSIHSYNCLHHDNRIPVSNANIYGAKFLRELGRTLRLFKPHLFMFAEDHSDWDEVTLPVSAGGMGFDGRWYADFYHHLAGDTEQGNKAKLLYKAATSFGAGGLPMSQFADVLKETGNQKIVYNESHDEAGNSKGPFEDPDWQPSDEPDKKYTSHRSIVVSSNAAPLIGSTRWYAEARARFAWGTTVLSAGIPMTLFGEEVGAMKRFKYNEVLANKEDIVGLAAESGSSMFRFYSEINDLRLKNSGLRSTNIEIVYVHDDHRLIVFRRWDENQNFLIVGSLSDNAYPNGYNLITSTIGDGTWREIFNSDSSNYNGHNIGNYGGICTSRRGCMNVVIPAAGFVILQNS